MDRTIPSAAASALLACSVLASCATSPDSDLVAAASWNGKPIKHTAGVWRSPSSATRHPDGRVTYRWMTQAHCSDVGYRVLGNSVYPVSGCGLGCAWDAVAAPDGTIERVGIVRRDSRAGCSLPAYAGLHAKAHPIGAFHTDPVRIVSRADSGAVVAMCSTEGSFDFPGLVGATPGLWPPVGACCTTKAGITCAPLAPLTSSR
jgi:hypothetical protein